MQPRLTPLWRGLPGHVGAGPVPRPVRPGQSLGVCDREDSRAVPRRLHGRGIASPGPWRGGRGTARSREGGARQYRVGGRRARPEGGSSWAQTGSALWAAEHRCSDEWGHIEGPVAQFLSTSVCPGPEPRLLCAPSVPPALRTETVPLCLGNARQPRVAEGQEAARGDDCCDEHAGGEEQMQACGTGSPRGPWGQARCLCGSLLTSTPQSVEGTKGTRLQGTEAGENGLSRARF